MSPLIENPEAHAAEERVAWPAWGLILCGLVGAVSAVLMGLIGLFSIASGDLTRAVGSAELSSTMIVLVSALQGALSLVILTGGWRARVLEGHTHAMIASVLLAVPCCVFVGCGPVNLIVGVWAILRLREPQVRAAFV
jgi:hypothetical protein